MKEAHILDRVCDFFTSQGLSGYGTFGSYLKKMKKREDETCRCGAVSESPAHVFKECSRHTLGRPEVLNGHKEETLKYMKATVEKLWKEEREEVRMRTEENL